MDEATKKAIQEATRILGTTPRGPKPQKEIVRHVIASDGRGRRGRSAGGNLWPYASEALGCNPEQIAEAQEQLRAHGVSCDFDAEGRPIIQSQKHMNAVATAFGLRTGAHGYGVPGEDGGRCPTGRESAEGRARLRAELAKSGY